MGRELESQVPEFMVSNHLIGCMAQVINLAVKAGIETFDSQKGSQVQLSLPLSLTRIVKQ